MERGKERDRISSKQYTTINNELKSVTENIILNTISINYKSRLID